MSAYPSRSFRPREPLHRRNGKIRAREVRVIGADKQQLGVMSLNEALRLAQQQNLDLVEIAPNATPPVCRIVNYGKLLYEESKKESHARQAGSRFKEIQISPVIDANDLATKRNHAIRFLSHDIKVRVKLRFRGRQKAHKEIGFDVIKKFVDEVSAYGQADAPPKMMGDRDVNVTISPLPRNKRPKATEPPPDLEEDAEKPEDASDAGESDQT